MVEYQYFECLNLNRISNLLLSGNKNVISKWLEYIDTVCPSTISNICSIRRIDILHFKMYP